MLRWKLKFNQKSKVLVVVEECEGHEMEAVWDEGMRQKLCVVSESVKGMRWKLCGMKA